MRKVFLEDLPRHNGENNKIDWKNSIDYKVKFIYNNIEGEIKIVDYNEKYLYIKYLDKDIFKILPNNFKKCKLGKLLGKITNEFRVDIGKVFIDDKRDLIVIDREYKIDKNNNQNRKWYKYKCNKCGYDKGWIDEGNLLKGNGCSCCCPAPKVVVEGINSIVDTDIWMIKYFQGGYNEAKLYTKASDQKIQPICPDCGRVKNKYIRISRIYDKKAINCVCGDGMNYPEKIMFSFIKQLNIEFEYQYIPNWCKYNFKNKLRQGRYDFYFELDNKRYIVETDGGWHNEYNTLSGQTKEESKYIDNEKDRLADEYGIEIIRIDCEKSDLDYIKNNISNSNLNDLFDLSNIDWLKCEEFALSNLCKKVCEIKKDNPNLTTTEIGKILKIGNITIGKYLKKGTKLGWCNYDPKEENFRASSRSGKMNGKPIEIFKNGIKLAEFASCNELERQSEKLFDVKLDNRSISGTCLGKQKSYKGFTFKYIDKLQEVI